MDAGPLRYTTGLRPGDVVQYSLRLRAKSDGEPYWMTRFGAVTDVISGTMLEVLTLVLHPDPKYEPRLLHLSNRDTSVKFLPEDRWPQGVMAVRMKHIMLGAIKLDDLT